MSIIAFRRMREQNEAAAKAASLAQFKKFQLVFISV